MATNFAKTSFGTTPDDKAVVVDIYDKPPLTPTNTQPSSLIASLNNFIGTGSLGGGLIKELTNNYLTKGKLFDFSLDAAVSGAGKALGIPNANLYDLGGATLDGVLKGTGFYGTGLGELVDGISTSITGNSLEKNLLGGYRDVVVAVNDANTLIKGVQNADSFTDIAGLLAGVTGDSSFVKVFDLTEAAGLMKGINDLAIDLQIPGVLDKLMEDVDESNRGYVSSLIASGTTTWNSLDTVDTLLANLTAAELLSANPNVVAGLVAGYCATTEYPTASAAAGDALIARLVKINAHWDMYTEDGVNFTLDQYVFNCCNDFTRECFIQGGKYLAALAVTPSTTQGIFTNIVTDQFPYIGFQ